MDSSLYGTDIGLEMPRRRADVETVRRHAVAVHASYTSGWDKGLARGKAIARTKVVEAVMATVVVCVSAFGLLLVWLPL